MSKPVFEDLFRLSGRRNRKSYLLFSLANLAVIAAAWFIAGLVTGDDENYVVIGLAGLVTLICTVSGWIVAGQRCRDFGWTGWAPLIVLLPFFGWIFGFALFFVPGTLGPNRYGPDLLNPTLPAVAPRTGLASKPVFTDLFRISGRRNRKSFVLLHLVMAGVGLMWAIPAMAYMIDLSPRMLSGEEMPPAVLFFQVSAFVLSIPMTIIGVLAMVQRCHDFDRSGWWVLLWPIPVVGFFFFIALLFIAGTIGPNRYGPDPLAPAPIPA